METVSHRIAALAESQTMAMNQKTRDLQAKGVNVINMTVGEPDFNTPDHIKEAAKKAIDENYSFYSPNPGYPELIQAIVGKFKRENGLDYSPAQIIVSNGAKHSLANVMMSVINKGDEIILPAPYWVSYYELVRLAEGTNVVLDTTVESNWKITPAQLEKAITPKTKALILCSPSNPTGSVYTQSEMEALAKVLDKYPQIYVIADEIYEHIRYQGEHRLLATLPGMRERTVTISGLSKTFSCTGWRLGYAIAPAEITSAIRKVHDFLTVGAPAPLQEAAAVGLRLPADYYSSLASDYRERRDLLCSALSRCGFRFSSPEGAYYVLADYSQLSDLEDRDFAIWLAREGGVATVPGSSFYATPGGGRRSVRFAFCKRLETLQAAVQRWERLPSLV